MGIWILMKFIDEACISCGGLNIFFASNPLAVLHPMRFARNVCKWEAIAQARHSVHAFALQARAVGRENSQPVRSLPNRCVPDRKHLLAWMEWLKVERSGFR